MEPVLNTTTADRMLRELAVSFGVQTRYRDGLGRWHVAPTQTLIKILRALGSPVTGPGDAAAALELRRADRADRRLEPVVVGWRNRAPRARLRLPVGAAHGRVELSIAPEPGEEGIETGWSVDPGS